MSVPTPKPRYVAQMVGLVFDQEKNRYLVERDGQPIFFHSVPFDAEKYAQALNLGTAMPGADPQIFEAAQDLLEFCESEDWSDLWTFLNRFAAGQMQEELPRRDPSLILAETYYRLAQIDAQRRVALQKANRGAT